MQVQPNEAGEPVTVSVPTLVEPDSLAERTDLGNHPVIIAVQNDTRRTNAVNVTVEWDGEFILQTARVGVGSAMENPEPYYLTRVENCGDRVTVEARDRFNNAESGVDVNVSDGASLFEQTEKATAENGRATFEVVNNASGNATLAIPGNASVEKRVDVCIDAARGGSSGGGGGGDNTAPTVDITDIQVNEAGGSGNVQNVDATFLPDDVDGNLDDPTVILGVAGTEQDRIENYDLTGQEGQSQTVNLNGYNANGEVVVEVIVFDTQGDQGSDRKSENDV